MRGLAGITDFLISCVQEELFAEEEQTYFKKVIDSQIFMLSLYEQFDSLGQSKGFLGEQNLKISHDLFAGSSGILLVLQRYNDLKSEEEMTKPSEFSLYLVAEIFDKWRLKDESSSVMA